jgi:hypothetical protein
LISIPVSDGTAVGLFSVGDDVEEVDSVRIDPYNDGKFDGELMMIGETVGMKDMDSIASR